MMQNSVRSMLTLHPSLVLLHRLASFASKTIIQQGKGGLLASWGTWAPWPPKSAYWWDPKFLTQFYKFKKITTTEHVTKFGDDRLSLLRDPPRLRGG